MSDSHRLVGSHRLFREAIALAERVAQTRATVLIVGETGTGKELIARHLHAQSERCRMPFLAVNCGAIAESLVVSELFGHARGAFTGAHSKQSGRFEAANGGTLFLDEVPSMSEGLQASLLRVLQSGEYYPVGSSRPTTTDVRVIAATNRNLRELVEAGAFRADLYYRLNIIRIELPPLRERRSDLAELAAHFLAQLTRQYGRELRLAPGSMARLHDYDFPGNVRELESILLRAALLTDGPELSVEGLLDAPSDSAEAPRAADLSEPFHQAKERVVERFERDYLHHAMARSRGVISEAARSSGLSERNFHVKLRKYGMRRRSRRSTGS